MKIIKLILVFCAGLIVVSGCSTTKSNAVPDNKVTGKTVSNSVTIKGGRSYEDCVELKPGQVFDYDYSASDNVDFNVHYHGKEDVHYPATIKGRFGGKGTIDPEAHAFYTPDQEYYCLMWENQNDETVKVSFTCSMRNK